VRVSDALRCGVIQIATGAWYDVLDPADSNSLEIYGNRNPVTDNIGTSSLAQGPSAESCLVEVERYDGDLPPLKVLSLPAIVERQDAGPPDRWEKGYTRRLAQSRAPRRLALLARIIRWRGVARRQRLSVRPVHELGSQSRLVRQ
jgi:hypothetical protein